MLFIGGGACFAVVALFQVVAAATMFGAGHLADRTGPRLVLGGGLPAHRRVRVGEFRHPPSRWPYRPDHYRASDLRIGTYLGAAVFDTTGAYDIAFKTMLAVSLLAVLLTLLLRQPRLIG